MGTTHFSFDLTQSQKTSIWLNSWRIMALQELIQTNSRLKINIWNLIQVDSLLKKLSKVLFKSTLDTKNLQNLIWINSWLNYAIHFQFRITFLGIWFYCWLGKIFLGCPLKCWRRMTFFGLSTQLLPLKIDLNQLMTEAVSRWIDLTHNSSGFDSSEFPGIDSDRLITQNASRFLDSEQLMTQAEKQLILSRLLIRLWVIPISASA